MYIPCLPFARLSAFLNAQKTHNLHEVNLIGFSTKLSACIAVSVEFIAKPASCGYTKFKERYKLCFQISENLKPHSQAVPSL